MSHIKDLIVNGVTRVLGKLIANEISTDSITAITASNRDANKCFNTNGAIHRLAFIPGTGTNSAKLNGSTSVASKNYAVAEGDNTTASGYASHTEGSGTVGHGFISHAEGHTTKAFGSYSHTEGYETNTGSESEGSIGQAAHAEGWETYAHGNYSHTEGYKTSAGSGFVGLGEAAHAEGNSTYASGTASHAEGYDTYASNYAHSEGYNTNAYADYSHTEGKDTATYGLYSHAEGLSTIAGDVALQGKVYAAHAEGENTTASGNYSHAEGRGSTASGIASHAEGSGSVGSGYCSHAGGYFTKANSDFQTAIGKYNSTSSGYFIVGKGSNSNARSNAFRVGTDGKTYSAGAHNTSGADYAEYFEWEDSNPNNEDRIGHFVALNNNGKIEIGTSNSDIIGIVSGNASVVGNAFEDTWSGMYLYDVYGRPIIEEIEEERVIGIDDDSNEIKETVKRTVQKVNPDYDPNQTYIPRSQRPEWDVIGLLGQLIVIDDGTCQVGERCSCNDQGIATVGSKYRVIKRLDNTHIVVLASFLN